MPQYHQLTAIIINLTLFDFLPFCYQFPPGNAVELAAALARKERTMEFINAALSITEQLKLNHCYLKMSNRHRSAWESENGGPGSSGMDDFLEVYTDADANPVFSDLGYDDDDDDDDDEYILFEDKEAVY
jgi:hypothetical protein